MKELPPGLEHYRSTAEFTELTVPAALLKRHRTKEGVWGRIVVKSGELHYRILEPSIEEHILNPNRFGVVEPGVGHEVVPVGPVKFVVEFLR